MNKKVKQKVTPRERQLQAKYGISEGQWDAIYEYQNGVCPICLKPIFKPNNPEGKRAASVDHDHRGNKRVRGLLDYRCNRFVIGRNSAERAKRVAEYLLSEFDGRQL